MIIECRKLVVLTLTILSTFFFSMRQSEAGLISSSEVFRSHALEQKRAQVLGFLGRTDVEAQLVKLGVSPEEARFRAQSLTDDEVLKISSRLDQLPAGQDGFGSVLGFILIIFVILLITDILHLTKVFPFTR